MKVIHRRFSSIFHICKLFCDWTLKNKNNARTMLPKYVSKWKSFVAANALRVRSSNAAFQTFNGTLFKNASMLRTDLIWFDVRVGGWGEMDQKWTTFFGTLAQKKVNEALLFLRRVDFSEANWEWRDSTWRVETETLRFTISFICIRGGYMRTICLAADVVQQLIWVW